MARILIAEDSDTELEYLKLILHETPHDLTITRDGLEAEAAAKSAPFDLIILLTEKTESSDKFWGLKQGADEYITKPYESTELLRTIEQQLGASQ